MARKKKEPEAPAGSPAWMATFCDMMTLVLVFFVLLYSMSSVDVEKWKALVINFTGNPAIFDYSDPNTSQGDSGMADPPAVSMEDMIAESDEWQVIAQELMDKLSDYQNNQERPSPDASPSPGGTPAPSSGPSAGPAPNNGIFITIETKDTEILIRCHGDVLFDSGKADLREEFRETIDWIMEEMIIPQLENENVSVVRIEGHTDERQLSAGSKYDDNWDLSSARARSVLYYVLARFSDIKDNKYSVNGYADARPVNPDGKSDPAQYDINRRVEFVMVRNLDKLPKTIIANPVIPTGEG